MNYFDVHNHLYREEFSQDISDVVASAEKVGVKGCLVVAEKTENFDQVLKLNERFPHFCLPCLGLHPVQGDDDGEARSVNEKDLVEALPLIDQHHEKLVAIGEVGLDFTPRFCKSDGDKEQQRLVLTKHIEYAKKYDLPINVHSRSAGRPTIALLKELGVTKALLHAFDGRPSVAMEGVAAGYYFSIPPSIVRSEQKQKLVKQLPLENILLETDSPALGPEKQVRNVPGNIEVSCRYIAEVKKVDVETVARITFENTLKLFPKIRNYVKL